MSKRIDAEVATLNYDGLIVDNVPVADVVTVKLAAGNGVLARGTVLADTGDGDMVPAVGPLRASVPMAILADDVDTTKATVATAYRTGHFARSKLIFGEDYVLNKQLDEPALQMIGILLSDAL